MKIASLDANIGQKPAAGAGFTSQTARSATATDRTSTMQALSEKFPRIDFGVANATGSKGGIKVAIDPHFQEKLANDPELTAQYEQFFADLPAADQMLRNSVHAMGSELVDWGVTIDKDGNITSWSVTRHESHDSPDKTDTKKSGIFDRWFEALQAAQDKRQERAETGNSLSDPTAKPVYTRSEFTGLFENLTGESNVQTSLSTRA